MYDDVSCSIYEKRFFRKNYGLGITVFNALMMFGFGFFINALINSHQYIVPALILFIVSGLLWIVFCVLQYSEKNCTTLEYLWICGDKNILEQNGYDYVSQDGNFVLGVKRV